MAEPLFRDSEFECIRFTCECHSSSHGVDISVEKKGIIMVNLWSWIEWKSLKRRFIDAFKVLLGKGIQIDDVEIQSKDIPALIELLNKALIIK